MLENILKMTSHISVKECHVKKFANISMYKVVEIEHTKGRRDIPNKV